MAENGKKEKKGKKWGFLKMGGGKHHGGKGHEEAVAAAQGAVGSVIAPKNAGRICRRRKCNDLAKGNSSGGEVARSTNLYLKPKPRKALAIDPIETPAIQDSLAFAPLASPAARPRSTLDSKRARGFSDPVSPTSSPSRRGVSVYVDTPLDSWVQELEREGDGDILWKVSGKKVEAEADDAIEMEGQPHGWGDRDRTEELRKDLESQHEDVSQPIESASPVTQPPSTPKNAPAVPHPFRIDSFYDSASEEEPDRPASIHWSEAVDVEFDDPKGLRKNKTDKVKKRWTFFKKGSKKSTDQGLPSVFPAPISPAADIPVAHVAPSGVEEVLYRTPIAAETLTRSISSASSAALSSSSHANVAEAVATESDIAETGPNPQPDDPHSSLPSPGWARGSWEEMDDRRWEELDRWHEEEKALREQGESAGSDPKPEREEREVGAMILTEAGPGENHWSMEPEEDGGEEAVDESAGRVRSEDSSVGSGAPEREEHAEEDVDEAGEDYDDGEEGDEEGEANEEEHGLEPGVRALYASAIPVAALASAQVVGGKNKKKKKKWGFFKLHSSKKHQPLCSNIIFLTIRAPQIPESFVAASTLHPTIDTVSSEIPIAPLPAADRLRTLRHRFSTSSFYSIAETPTLIQLPGSDDEVEDRGTPTTGLNLDLWGDNSPGRSAGSGSWAVDEKGVSAGGYRFGVESVLDDEEVVGGWDQENFARRRSTSLSSNRSLSPEPAGPPRRPSISTRLVTTARRTPIVTPKLVPEHSPALTRLDALMYGIMHPDAAAEGAVAEAVEAGGGGHEEKVDLAELEMESLAVTHSEEDEEEVVESE
ncbi:hypothetical protein BDK51DRAFT_51572, partial [Blyttiomyces helicus]